MTARAITDWDDAYDNAGHIPDAASYPPRWMAQAAAFREALVSRAECGLAYGPEPRAVLDLFRPEGTPRGLIVFVHGGYWLKFDGSVWSHLAAGAVARGWAVAMPTYTLCPEARISRITAQIARAVGFAAARVPGPVRLTGHSAGGHLVTRMMCEGSGLADDVAARLDRVVSISGLHDLRPLLRTGMNAGLRLDAAEAVAESPALLTPRPGVALTCWVGAAERPEFVRQNALLANIWRGLGIATTEVEDAGRHHFDVIDGLATTDHPLTGILCG